MYIYIYKRIYEIYVYISNATDILCNNICIIKMILDIRFLEFVERIKKNLKLKLFGKLSEIFWAALLNDFRVILDHKIGKGYSSAQLRDEVEIR